MAFSEIKPGQRDWLKILNESLTNNKWNRKTLAGTLLNGTTGWVSGTIGYDSDMYVACITGWINLPNEKVSQFSTNPFDGILDVKGLPVIGSAFVGLPNGSNNFSPIHFTDSGILEIRAGQGDVWNAGKYAGWITMTFSGPRDQLKI
ncbi:MAG: hypothetical protein ACI31O_03630 [Limosilactobacillus vaginalis]|uniref:hypothetical protein n=1 Tax=Limosilactobacillus vaginalis TaxID=1633 RepID=UPI003F0F526C